jgi:hypothetical protein
MQEMIISVGGIVYGVVLVCIAFMRNRFAEALRIDALIVPQPSETTRMLNPLIGLALIGYQLYVLMH